MKRILTLSTALLLAPLAALHAKDQVSNAPATGDVRDVRVVRTADQEPRASLLGQPTIALWKERHLVVAYQKGIAGKTDMGSIDAIVSCNDGDSWSIPSTIFDHEQRHNAMQFGYCNAVLYHPPGQQVLWSSAMRCPLNDADSEDSHLGPAFSRMPLRYKMKPANGGWNTDRTFFDAGIHNSYPTLIETAPGEFRAVWDSGDEKRHRRSIRFGKFTLKP